MVKCQRRDNSDHGEISKEGQFRPWGNVKVGTIQTMGKRGGNIIQTVSYKKLYIFETVWCL